MYVILYSAFQINGFQVCLKKGTHFPAAGLKAVAAISPAQHCGMHCPLLSLTGSAVISCACQGDCWPPQPPTQIPSVSTGETE